MCVVFLLVGPEEGRPLNPLVLLVQPSQEQLLEEKGYCDRKKVAAGLVWCYQHNYYAVTQTSSFELEFAQMV